MDMMEINIEELEAVAAPRSCVMLYEPGYGWHIAGCDGGCGY